MERIRMLVERQRTERELRRSCQERYFYCILGGKFVGGFLYFLGAVLI